MKLLILMAVLASALQAGIVSTNNTMEYVAENVRDPGAPESRALAAALRHPFRVVGTNVVNLIDVFDQHERRLETDSKWRPIIGRVLRMEVTNVVVQTSYGASPGQEIVLQGLPWADSLADGEWVYTVACDMGPRPYPGGRRLRTFWWGELPSSRQLTAFLATKPPLEPASIRKLRAWKEGGAGSPSGPASSSHP